MADRESGSEKYGVTLQPEDEETNEEEDGYDDEVQNWDDWNAEEADEEEGNGDFMMTCLFCDFTFNQADSLFDHCILDHHFDFSTMRRSLRLDFYSSFKLINYVRSQVSL